MMDWRVMALHNEYTAIGMSINFNQLIGAYRGKVLSLRYSEDLLAPEKAIEAVLAKFKLAIVRRLLLDTPEIGGKADHFNWVRKPTAVVDSLSVWLEAGE